VKDGSAKRPWPAALDRASRIEGGLQRATYPKQRIDLRSELMRVLLLKGILKERCELERLHLRVSAALLQTDEYALNPLSTALYETSPQFLEIYHSLLQYLGQNIFPFDFLFQATPTIRVHAPVPFNVPWKTAPGELLMYHSDTMLGHPIQEINCWLPLTRAYGTSTLQHCPLAESLEMLRSFLGDAGLDEAQYFSEGRDRFVQKMISDARFRAWVMCNTVPMMCDVGEILIFDARCLHATSENRESDTRVSVDFRIIPLEDYEGLDRIHQSAGRSRRRFERGDIYSAKSVRELGDTSVVGREGFLFLERGS
jgi:hypothetical protein